MAVYHRVTIIIPALARVCSSLNNYYANKKLVFNAASEAKGTFIKYYNLCAIQMLCSVGSVLLLCKLIPIQELPIKLVVDCVLFLASFQIQRAYIFTDSGKEGTA